MRALHSRLLLALCIAGLFAASAHAAEYSWGSGAFSSANVPSPLVGSDTLKIDTTNNKTFDANFSNQSVVTWLGGTVTVNGATVANTGEFLAQGNLILSGMDRVASGFVNSGTLRKNDGNEALLLIGNLTLVNNGTLEAQLGRIHYNATGGQIFNAGTVFAGAGIHRVLQNATFNGAFTSNDRLELSESRRSIQVATQASPDS